MFIIESASRKSSTFSAIANLTVLKSSNDPYSKISESFEQFESTNVTVISPLSTLFLSLAHLSKLQDKPVVVHVNVSNQESIADFGLIASLRHSGFIFLQSFNDQDTRDTAFVAHLISNSLKKPVVHFYVSVETALSVSLISSDTVKNGLDKYSTEFHNFKNTISETALIHKAYSYVSNIVGINYDSFEYYGPKNATNALVLFANSTDAFVQALSQAQPHDQFHDLGLIIIRVYRPWSSADLLSHLPKSVLKLGLVEQIVRPTTTWSPLIQDLLADAEIIKLQLVSYQLGHVTYDNVRVALKAIAINLNLDKPVQKLFIGDTLTVDNIENSNIISQESSIKLENSYFKVLHQLFPNNLDIINAYDKPTTGFGNNPEFGFGAYIAKQEALNKLIKNAQDSLEVNDFSDANKLDILEVLASWVVHARKGIMGESDDQLISLLKKEKNSQTAHDLLSYGNKTFELKCSWLIGSDAWSYDLGNSGVHSVISSGKNLNMLIIDSEPYSKVVQNKSSFRKKDIGLYAMNFGNVYVASVALYSSYTQLLQALLEAEKFDGPSVVVAYLPYESQNTDALAILQETKRAVESGYWPLYRYNPNSVLDPFKLDSFHIKKSLQDFLSRENKLTLLAQNSPTLSRNLKSSYETEMKNKQINKAKKTYQKMLEGLSGPPLTILFASDGGTAEFVAKRLERRAKSKGLNAKVLVFDDFTVEELVEEENVVFITSTAGQGEFPQNGRALWEALKSSTDIELNKLKCSVFALGDSLYWPRKEDRIYYNKPGKDLSTCLQTLGVPELVPLGLGDDQDDDGYATAYSEWESLLWKALNVDGIVVADEPPPITNEDIKLGSDYLRGTIAQGLKDTSTGSISASDQQLTKFHGIYMQDDRDIREERKSNGLEPAYAFMVRVRLPGCVSTPDQWLKIDELSEKRGNGTFKITTRGTFQLHGVIKENLKPTIRGINSALIDTVAACGDVDRNVVTASLPGNAKIHKEIENIARKISEHLLPETTAYHEIWLEGKDDSDEKHYSKIFADRVDGPKKKKTMVSGSTLVDREPLYGPSYLPRKFKINIAVPPYNDVDVFAHDIGLVSIIENNELQGFNVYVGGGMGVTHNNKKTYPRTGSLLGYVVKQSIELVCEKIMLVQRDCGDRQNRKHARLKYTVDDLGIDVFRAKVEELLGYKFKPGKQFSFESNIDTFGWTTDEIGRHHFTLFVENGRVEDTPDLQFKTGLKKIAKVLKKEKIGRFRLTANQHILVSEIPSELKPQITQLLAQYKLDNVSFSGLRLSSAACVAFPTCGLAMAESERYLPQLITKLEDALEEYGLRHDSIVMRMTGCPNGCARPWVAEVALVGKAYGVYNLMLGGGYHGQRLNKLYRNSIKEDEIISILKPLFKRWALERYEKEHFGDFLVRVGVIAETTQGKNFWDNISEE